MIGAMIACIAVRTVVIHSLGEFVDRVTPSEPDSVTGRRRDTGVYRGSSNAKNPLLTSLDRLGAGTAAAHQGGSRGAHPPQLHSVLASACRHGPDQRLGAARLGAAPRCTDATAGLDIFATGRRVLRHATPRRRARSAIAPFGDSTGSCCMRNSSFQRSRFSSKISTSCSERTGISRRGSSCVGVPNEISPVFSSRRRSISVSWRRQPSSRSAPTSRVRSTRSSTHHGLGWSADQIRDSCRRSRPIARSARSRRRRRTSAVSRSRRRRRSHSALLRVVDASPASSARIGIFEKRDGASAARTRSTPVAESRSWDCSERSGLHRHAPNARRSSGSTFSCFRAAP